MKPSLFEIFQLWLVRGLIALCALFTLLLVVSGCAGTDARKTEQSRDNTQKTSIIRETGTQTVFRLNPVSGQLQPEERREWRQEQELSERMQLHRTSTQEASTAYAVNFTSTAGSFTALLPFLSGFGTETAFGGIAGVLAWLWWKVRNQRNQLIKSVEHARDVLPDDIDERFVSILAAHQDQDVKKVVQKYTT